MDSSHPEPLRLVTYNIAHGRGLSPYQGFQSEKALRNKLGELSCLLRSLNPDILAIQEIDEYSHWNHRLNLLKILREELQMPFAAMSAHNTRKSKKPLVYGNAVLSYLPLLESSSLPFGTKTMGEKGFQYLEFSNEDRILPLVNLHLDFQSRTNRMQQIEQVIHYLNERAADPKIDPPIICGDFNTTTRRFGDAVRHLFKSLCKTEHYTLLPRGKKTFPSIFPQRTLDFVFMPEQFKVVRTEVVKSFHSDHRPVMVDFIAFGPGEK